MAVKYLLTKETALAGSTKGKLPTPVARPRGENSKDFFAFMTRFWLEKKDFIAFTHEFSPDDSFHRESSPGLTVNAMIIMLL